MTAIKLAATLLLVLPFAILAASCGGGDSTASPTPTSPETATASATPNEAALPIPDPYELHLAAADGSGDETIFATDQTISYALSPDGSHIAVVEGLYNFAIVHFLNFDGTERARATYNGGSGGQTEWSPDGRYLVSTFNTAGQQALIAFSSDGSSQKLLSSQMLSFVLSGWLPDGELLVEQTNSANTGATLLAFDVNAGTSRSLTSLNAWVDYFGPPAVSPDGKALAVFVPGGTAACGSLATSTTIWTIDLASEATTQVTPDGFCGSGGMVWSPDGTQLAYSALITAGDSTLNIVDVATGQLRTVTHGLDNVIAWLPDGMLLANEYNCINCDGGVLHLFAVDSAGGARHDLTGRGTSSVSPSGRIVTADGAVKTLDASGQQLAVLAPQESGWGYFSFAWSHDESHIAYLRFHTTGTRVFEVNRDGSGFQQTAYSTESDPQLSPDGKRFAYLHQTPGVNEKSGSTLWLANPDGSNARQVDVSGSVNSASWSPDSTRLLFSAVEAPGAAGTTYTVNADGGGVREVTVPAIYEKGGPSFWAPNGKLVAFSGAPMTVLNVDSGDITSVSPGTQKGIPTWSADSSQLIYPVFNSQNGTDIYISNVDGSGTTQIPGGANSQSGLAVSPDGSKIAYISAQGDSAGLVIANIDGSDKISVLDGASLGGGGPAWSPDGDWLAVQSTQDGSTGLFVVRADGSEAKQLTRGFFSGVTWDGNDRMRLITFIGGL